MSNLSIIRANELIFHEIQQLLLNCGIKSLQKHKLVYLWNNQFVTFDAFSDNQTIKVLPDNVENEVINLNEQNCKTFVLQYLSENQMEYSDVERPNQLFNVQFLQSDLSFDVITVDDSQQFMLVSIQ